MVLQLGWPVQNPVITQGFGENRTGVPDFYTRIGLPGHEGLDFQAPNGTEILACAAGTITRIDLDGNNDPEGRPYGNQIRLTHITPEGEEYETTYAHLLSIKQGLQVGDHVQAGAVIALADNTGNAPGDQLHLMLKKTGSTLAGETWFPRDIMDPTPFLPLATVGFPPLPAAFNGQYRFQMTEQQFRPAWSWGDGSGSERWLYLIATPNAPYSNPAQRNQIPDPARIEAVIRYLNPNEPPNGTQRYYVQSGSTFCNIFVNDATRILNCEIPNNPERTWVSYMAKWLRDNGAAAGWTQANDGQAAQDHVNAGHVAVMICSQRLTSDHVALVRPGVGRLVNNFFYPRVAQAGMTISSDLDSSQPVTFGSLPSNKIQFYLHD
ncbi:MAG TPA: M23 family metallopeptidase [Phototrophicaceae bacterium]|jgi:hypothetical protein|nr:M23 family metallopeptidase [Phototrophicaceae bacterium]